MSENTTTNHPCSSLPAIKLRYTLCILLLFSVEVISQTAGIISDISFKDGKTALLTGENGLIMKSINGGVNWVDISGNLTNVLHTGKMTSYIADNTEKDIILTAGSNGVIMRSTDEGNSWDIKTEYSMEDLHDILIYDQNNYYICGNNGTLIKSTDQGITWGQVQLNTSPDLNSLISMPPASSRVINIIAVGQNGACMASTNMVDWFTITLPVQEDVLSITSYENTVICGTETGKILRSTNRGNSWSVISSGVTTELYQIEFIDQSTLVGTTSQGKVVRSTDSGVSWNVISTPVTHYLNAMAFGSSVFGIAGGTTDSLLYTTNGGLNWSLPVVQLAVNYPLQKAPGGLKNYPNPFNPVTKIIYNLQDPGNVNLTVYDMTGKVVKTLVNSNQAAGSFSVSFEASGLASGIYFYVLRFNDGSTSYSETNRMILTK